MKINKICIVGGGSSGWMTAAGLSKHFPNIDITLIESDTPPVGVGESTLGHFNDFLNFLDLKDKDWMAYCNATYKTSIAFKNFREGKGERFQYPFGVSVKNDDSFMYYYLKHLYPNMYPPEEGARFFNRQTLIAESGKFTDGEIKGTNFNHDIDAAYHFDAALFGQFLKEKIAIPNGVSHFYDKISYCTKDEKGNIKAIHTDKGESFSADLFIDCTGFKSLLLEKFMEVPFISFKDFLFNDTALVTPVPYIDKENQMKNYTDCVALGNGWVWETPLWHRIGTGYVFSSRHTTIENAEREYREHLSSTYSDEIGKDAEFRKINIKHGKHTHSWKNNVVAVGLSYGFIEPLESTGLLTTHENIIQLAKILDMSESFITQKWIDKFNFNIDKLMDGMMMFVAYHYYLSQRKDTKYWEDCVNNLDIYHNSCQSNNGLFKKHLEETITFFYDTSNGFLWDFANTDRIDLVYIAMGQGISPISKFNFLNDISNNENLIEGIEQFHKHWQKERKDLLKELDKLPTHFEFLKNNIYGRNS